MDDGVEVSCTVCGKIWKTKAKKKAICTNQDCKSTKVIITATGEKYAKSRTWIDEKSSNEEKELNVESFDENEKEGSKVKKSEKDTDDIFKVLFEDDGKTPKATKDDLKSIFKGLPKPSPQFTKVIQNISVIPARIFGAHWLMAFEEAEFIAQGLIPVLREIGIRLDKISPRIILLGAVAAYAVPRVIQEFFIARARKKGETPPDLDLPDMDEPDLARASPEERYSSLEKQAAGIAKRSDVAQAVNDQAEAFMKKYGGSVDEFGNDLFKDRRGIKKPY